MSETRQERREVTGIEAEVCADIAERQEEGLANYPTELAENQAPLSERIQHAYEEDLDKILYLKWAKEEAEKQEVELGAAWQIINILALNTLDSEGETWPRALDWLRRNESFGAEERKVRRDEKEC